MGSAFKNTTKDMLACFSIVSPSELVLWQVVLLVRVTPQESVFLISISPP